MVRNNNNYWWLLNRQPSNTVKCIIYIIYRGLLFSYKTCKWHLTNCIICIRFFFNDLDFFRRTSAAPSHLVARERANRWDVRNAARQEGEKRVALRTTWTPPPQQRVHLSGVQQSHGAAHIELSLVGHDTWVDAQIIVQIAAILGWSTLILIYWKKYIIFNRYLFLLLKVSKNINSIILWLHHITVQVN